MAKQHTNMPLSLFFLFFLLLVLVPLSSSAARLLIIAAKTDAVDLPGGRAAAGGGGDASSGIVLPCNTAASGKAGNAGFEALRRCGRRGQMLLSMLPKGGVVPPSAPSRRTNGNNN